ncbi:hypothetical protein P261_01683 [Lachnospiraceae bacterium TWA4]|nr:hypothetical protein P261_01683 [Lachnospiraceae bacterium TWA4]
MGLFGNQLANVVEWENFSEDDIFFKWHNKEIKKGSRLILRPGQDAIFLYNGKVEGIFKDDGSFDIETQIIPFLSTLKGFKFGFNSGMRAEVLFVNTREFTVKWGTKNAINLPVNGLPGGMPIRAFGTFSCKVRDYLELIEKIAGVQNTYSIESVKDRVGAIVDQLLMKWIVKEGKDMFNLQANAYDISKGIVSDLDMELARIGMAATDFTIQSVSYPEEVRKMQEKVAAQSMLGGNLGVYQGVAMADSMANGHSSVADMAGMSVGLAMGQQMAAAMSGNMNAMNNPQSMNNQQAVGGQQQVQGGGDFKFCPNCGTKITKDAKFCVNCGTKLM